MTNFSREQLAVVWCAAVLVLSAAAIVAGAGITVGNGVLMLLAGIGPAAVMMLIWQPAPLTAAELLHEAHARGDR